MSSISIGTVIRLGLQGAGAEILSKSETLNGLVSRITSGRINKDVLAERAWHTTIDLVQQTALADRPLRTLIARLLPQLATELVEGIDLAQKTLGPRLAPLLSQLSTAAVTGNATEARAATHQMVRDNVAHILNGDQRTLSGPRAMMTKALAGPISGIAEKLRSSYLGENAAEKVLTTMVAQHGWQPMKKLLEHSLGSFPGRDFLIRRIENVMNMAFINKAGRNQSHSPEYALLADLAHLSITTADQDQMKERIRAYAPDTVGAIETAIAINAKRTQLVDATKNLAARVNNAVCNASQYVTQIMTQQRAIQQDCNLATEPMRLDDAYAQAAQAAQAAADIGDLRQERVQPRLALTAAASDSQIADAFLSTLVTSRIGAGRTAANIGRGSAAATTIASTTITAAMQQAAPSRRKETKDLLDKLSPEQVAPLGERSSLSVVKTLDGGLDTVLAASHRWLGADQALTNRIEERLHRFPTHTALLGNYQVGRAFAAQVGELQLTLPLAKTGYVQNAIQGGQALLGAGWRFLQNQTNQANLHDEAYAPEIGTRLAQLYDVCGRDDAVMKEVSRYLDQETAASALGGATLQHFAHPGGTTPVITEQGLSMTLANATPQIRFAVRRDEDKVIVEIEAAWPITAFKGPDGLTRHPIGTDHQSSLVASSLITIRRGAPDAPLLVEHVATGTLATINNQLRFERDTGRLQTD